MAKIQEHHLKQFAHQNNLKYTGNWKLEDNWIVVLSFKFWTVTGKANIVLQFNNRMDY